MIFKGILLLALNLMLGAWRVTREAWAMIVFLFMTSCGAAPLVTAAAGYATSGGVTLYKSSKDTYTAPAPKAEFVLIKVEANHIVYQQGPTK